MQNNDKKFSLCVALNSLSFLSVEEKNILLKKLDTLTDLVILSKEDISNLILRDLRNNKIEWNGEELKKRTEIQVALIEKLNIKCTAYNEESFPLIVKEIPDSPLMLFYRGNIDILKNECVSVVGTRRITYDGKKASHDFAYDACSEKVTVVSGLAVGVDTEAHKGALDAFYDAKSDICRTAAIIPAGIDCIVPQINKKLAANIIEHGGCVVSECAPSVPVEKWRFVQRNRLIAALSRATVVIQAPPGSGAMITASFALDYNRDVMFHKACFSENAKTISGMVKKNLEMNSLPSKKKKLEQTPELYLNDGAQVIEDYKDYCSTLCELPGKRNNSKYIDMQPSLF